MDSFNNPRFPANLPVFGHNYAQGSNFGPNPGGGRPSFPPFQRFTAPAFTPYPSPEVFNVASLVSAPPPFTSFPTNFLSRPPPVNVVGSALTRPAGNVWSQQPPFGAQSGQPPFSQGALFKPSASPVQSAASVSSFSLANGPPQTSYHQRSQQPFASSSSRTLFGSPMQRPSPSAGSQNSSFAGNRHHQMSGPSSSRPHYFSQQKSGKVREFKKLKDNNAEKPFSCDTCDRAFANKDEFQDHTSQHIKCGLGGCTFEAHPKIVAIHRKMQHETGYASVINKLKDDAEIQKWREERKRRFPTAANIQKRLAEQEEKAARGEVLETKEFGKFKRPRTDAASGELNASKGPEKRQFRKRKGKFRDWRNQHYKSHPNFKPVVLDVSSDSDSGSDSHISLKRFPGILALSASENQVPELTEEVVRTDISSANSQCNISQGNSSCKPDNLNQISHEIAKKHEDSMADSETNVNLLDKQQNDNSSKPENGETNETNRTIDKSILEISIDQESTEPLEIIDVSDDDISIVPPGETLVNGNHASDDESPDVLPISKAPVHENLTEGDSTALAPNQDAAQKNDDIEISQPVTGDLPVEQPNMKNKAHIKNGQFQNGPQKKSWTNNQANKTMNPAPPPKSSLLEKLLADDIRHERNVVLQCIRHIVNKNFFGVGARR